VTPRLSLDTLDRLARNGAWSPPAVDPRALRTGIVHLGVGAFHRAHQAVFTEAAAERHGSTEWGIAGVTQRSATVCDQLVPQDGLYGVLERGTDGTRLQVVGSIRDVVDGASDPEGVVQRLSDPGVRVVTITVTEKGYRRAADGGLDLTDPGVAADLAGGPPQTVVGQLVRGLRRRHEAGGAPVTVLSCDNLTANGRVLRGLVDDFCRADTRPGAGAFADWLVSGVRFPSSMVDRIVPATSARDHEEADALLGAHDAGLVVAEPFRQWVVEDDFAAARPAWEDAGVVLTGDVAPWETVKLRVLNGAHSMLAYLGLLAGHGTIAEAVADPELAEAARALLLEDVTPTLDVPAGLDLPAYRDEVLERFANPALRHRTAQVASDGSQKLPIRLLGTVRDRLRAGAVPHWATLAVAAWMVCLADGRDRRGRPFTVEDPLADRLRGLAAGAPGPAGLVDRFLAVREVFGEDLPDHRDLRDALVAHVRLLRTSGA